MTLELFVMWVVVGLAAGWLAGFVMKGGGYGLFGDIALGLVGSIVGSLVFRALGISLGAGLIAAIVVASIGAVVLIGAQRMFRHMHA